MITSHTVTSDRTMLGERFMTCTCGHVAQGGAYGKLADQNFAYHLVMAAHDRLDAAEEAVIRARVLDAALMAEYADASHAYFATLQAHDFSSAGRIHREHYSTCRPQTRERVQAELVAAGTIRVCSDGAWEYLPKVTVTIKGEAVEVPEGAWVGWRNGSVLTWFSTRRQADIAVEHSKIDSASQAAELARDQANDAAFTKLGLS